MILQVEGVDLYYGDAQALDGISIGAAEGELVAIVGANGAGKTSLIRTIAGMEAPRAGTITYRGADITGLPSHRICNLGIGQVAEGRQIFPTLTVEENLEMGGLLPRARGVMAETMRDVFAMFPRLAERRNQAAGTMSGGEQQMLAMSRALATDPAVLLLDELSMGLAPLIVGQLYDIVKQVAESGVSILVVEQFATAVLGIADIAAIMLHGEITRIGTPTDIEAELSSAYLGG